MYNPSNVQNKPRFSNIFSVTWLKLEFLLDLGFLLTNVNI